MRALILACLIALLAPCAGGATDAGSVPPVPAREGSAQVLVFLKVQPLHFRPDGNYAVGYADAAGRSARRRIAEALALTHGLRMATDWPIPTLGLDCYVMDVPTPRSPQEVADQLSREPQVSWAQVMNVFRPLGHDDPLYSMQPAARLWHLDELHTVAGGRGV